MRDIFGNQCTIGNRVAWPGHQGSATYLMKGEIIGWEDGGETVVIRCEPSGAITKKVHRWYPFAKASSK